jgi:hypothetical protein
MNRKKLNRFGMYLSVWRFLGDPARNLVINSIEAFAEHVAAFADLIPDMRRASRLANELSSQGETETKTSIRSELADEAARISAGVVTYATISKDRALASSAHVTRSMILGGREQIAADLADNLLAAALARVGSLKKYGVTRDLLDDFDELTQSFSESIGRPREVIRQRKAANGNLPELFDTADVHLGHLDKLSELLEKAHPEFVSGYRERRRIIHQSATRSLSEAEKASAAEREAKQAEKDAKKVAKKAADSAETSRTSSPSSTPRSGTSVNGTAEVSGLPD